MLTLETIVALYIITILIVLAAPLAFIKARASLQLAPKAKRPMMQEYQGQLFTHPSEDSCDLTPTTKHQALRIEGYTTTEEVNITIDAPANGWTHTQIEAHIAFNKLECWDAYLGTTWIGSSEV